MHGLRLANSLRRLACCAVLPAMLSSPVMAARPDGVRICSGDEIRYILLDPQERPAIPRQGRDEQACAHVTCPRSREMVRTIKDEDDDSDG